MYDLFVDEVKNSGIDNIENVYSQFTPVIQGKTFEVLERQVKESIPSNIEKHLFVAYEPVWAIGSGKTPKLEEIEKVFVHLHECCPGCVSFLYGGSVDSKNSCDILGIKNVDGLLVGGTSLKKEEFLSIIKNGKSVY